jgi:hypothetical protein
LARLTREYTDGGANIRAENEFGMVDHSGRQDFVAAILSLIPRGYPFRRPCIHG